MFFTKFFFTQVINFSGPKFLDKTFGELKFGNQKIVLFQKYLLEKMFVLNEICDPKNYWVIKKFLAPKFLLQNFG